MPSAVALWLFFVALIARAEPPGSWTAIAQIPAPEAVQAAAADAQFLYAINNTQVAKYDRQTGQRVAVSTGTATHLNSGFVREGRLYCAHSNYPQTPEQSEIKVLDAASMRLTTFKDFGNFGGSLTWAIFEDGHWWCNFARYGADNTGTFLAKFTPDWHEVARWRYPAELIRELGRYSLSGGIWRNAQLLVTGHDDPVLFRLRLPEAGPTLELLGQEAVPFTGQGIASDPVTGGLVGISRAKRQIVLASRKQPEPVRLRLLSYNIHHGEGVDGKLELARIAAIIRASKADIVALQEVDQNVARSNSVDQPAELARLTEFKSVFGENIPLQGGGYGNAVLSRFPIVRHQNHQLPNVDAGEQRGVLELEISLPGWEQPLVVLATHLDHRRDDRERRASATAINDLAAKHGDRPMVLAGDLNATPESAVLAEIGKLWQRSNDESQATIPVDMPARQIDYVLLRPRKFWKVIATTVLDEPVASDHRPILAEVELLPDGQSP